MFNGVAFLKHCATVKVAGASTSHCQGTRCWGVLLLPPTPPGYAEPQHQPQLQPPHQPQPQVFHHRLSPACADRTSRTARRPLMYAPCTVPKYLLHVASPAKKSVLPTGLATASQSLPDAYNECEYRTSIMDANVSMPTHTIWICALHTFACTVACTMRTPCKLWTDYLCKHRACIRWTLASGTHPDRNVSVRPQRARV